MQKKDDTMTEDNKAHAPWWTKELEESLREQERLENICMKGICPKCNGKVVLLLITANDGCWSEHFECLKCDFKLTRGAMTRCEGECNHYSEIEKAGRILTDIREITNTAHIEFEVVEDGVHKGEK